MRLFHYGSVLNDEKVIVLDKCKYGENYYVCVNEILPDESDVTDIFKIMIIHPEDGTLERIYDSELLNKLSRQLKLKRKIRKKIQQD